MPWACSGPSRDRKGAVAKGRDCFGSHGTLFVPWAFSPQRGHPDRKRRTCFSFRRISSGSRQGTVSTEKLLGKIEVPHCRRPSRSRAKRHSSLDGLPIVSRDASIKRPSFAPHPTYNGTAPRRITRFAGVRLMDFEILGNVSTIEPIAVGRGIRDRSRLQRLYGKGRWRKLRGIATVRLSDGTIHTAEVHWYEAHGIGRREFKLKFPLLD